MTTPVTPPILAERYRLEERFTGGGQSETYRALRLEDGRAVVVKVLKVAGLESWKGVELFEREGKALAGLDLDGVPRFIEALFDEGSGGDAAYYLVQELIEGETLAQAMAEGRRYTEPEVVHIAWQVLGLLESLHVLSPPIVHRDIKPSNIIVRPDGRCALVDFGAVTGVGATAGGDAPTVAGTFGYMAPEQMQGRAIPASDLYGVGACMVHLLAGRSPQTMEAPGLRLDFRPHIMASEPLCRLLDQLLDPIPESRIESASQARRALEQLDNEDDEDAGDGELVVVRSLREVEQVGQVGTLALFHSLPRGPRAVPGPYRLRFVRQLALTIGGGALGAAGAMFGLGALFGLGPAELFMILLLPFVFGYALLRDARRVRRLVRRGAKAEATVLAVQGRSSGWQVSYEFDVQGETMRGSNTITKVEVLLERGDRVGVLYSEKDPNLSMIFPVPAKAVTGLFEESE